MTAKTFTNPPPRLREHVSLTDYLALGFGAEARYFIEVQTVTELLEAVTFAKKHKLAYAVVGTGYALLLAEVYNGLIIKNNCRKFELVGKRGKFVKGELQVESAMLFAEAGTLLNQLVRYTIEDNLSGLENLLGLPGTIGGTLLSEDETSQTSLSQILLSVRYLNKNGIVQEAAKGDFIQKKQAGEDMVLLSCVLSLTPGDKKLLWEKATAASEKRLKKYPQETIIGEMFANIPLSEALRLPTPDNTKEAHVLIEKTGLLGKQVGSVKISDIYGNAIEKRGNVQRKDIFSLITIVQAEVKKKFGVDLKLRLRAFTL